MSDNRVRRLAVLGAVGAAGLAFAACGGSSGASTGSTAPRGNGSGGSAGSSTTPSSLPGASGTIASVSGATIEVQNDQTGQTTVTYTPTTTIRQTSATTAAAVTVGSCITAFGKPSSTASAKSSSNGPVTATTVSVSQPVSGTCDRGGFGGGARPGGFPGRPAGAEGGGTPNGNGSGGGSFTPPSGRSFRGGNFGGASGLVTAVAGSTVTVSETNPRTKKTTSVVVTLSSTATFTTTQTATSAAIVVGQCARAVGTAGSTGAVTATSLTVSAPTNGSCTTGFGFRGGAGGGPGGAPGRGRRCLTCPAAPAPSYSPARVPTGTGAAVHGTSSAPRPGRAGTWRLVVILVVVAALVVAWFTTRPSGPAYRTAAVTTGTATATLDEVGTITPVQQSNLTFTVAGTVGTVDVSVGQQVTAGQVVASLDPTSLDTAVVDARASLASAQATLATDETSQADGTSSSGTGSSAAGGGVSSKAPSGSGGSGGSSTPSGAQVAGLQAILVAAQRAQDAAATAAGAALQQATAACASSSSSDDRDPVSDVAVRRGSPGRTGPARAVGRCRHRWVGSDLHPGPGCCVDAPTRPWWSPSRR